MSFITCVISNIQEADISRNLKLGKAVAPLTRDVTQGISAASVGRVKSATHVETVTWRVCTMVITVTVAAGVGYFQLAKPGWEAAAEEGACAIVMEKFGSMMRDLHESVTKRRYVSSERSLLLQQKENDIAARAAWLDKWKANLVRKESDSSN